MARERTKEKLRKDEGRGEGKRTEAEWGRTDGEEEGRTMKEGKMRGEKKREGKLRREKDN